MYHNTNYRVREVINSASEPVNFTLGTGYHGPSYLSDRSKLPEHVQVKGLFDCYDDCAAMASYILYWDETAQTGIVGEIRDGVLHQVSNGAFDNPPSAQSSIPGARFADGQREGLVFLGAENQQTTLKYYDLATNTQHVVNLSVSSSQSLDNVRFIASVEKSIYLAFSDGKVYTTDLSALLEEPETQVTLEGPGIFQFNNTLHAFTAHENRLYGSLEDPTNAGEYILHEVEIGAGIVTEIPLGSTQCVALTKNGFSLYDPEAQATFTGNFLYLMIRENDQHCLQCLPLTPDGLDSAQSLSPVGKAFGYYEDSFAGMALDLYSGKMVLLGDAVFSVADPSYGTKIHMRPGEHWLLPTACARIPLYRPGNPDDANLQLKTQNGTHAEVFGNLSGESDQPYFRGYGQRIYAGNAQGFHPDTDMLIRLQLGYRTQAGGGIVIVTAMDIDPGHRIVVGKVEEVSVR
ncbi:MAG: hypothetical protein AAF570_06815 [Bacteroidota bacterium]